MKSKESTGNTKERSNGLLFTVTANFTAEPIEESLNFWTQRLELGPVRFQFSGYNQIFQELMSPDSALVSRAAGANFLLIRIEDWARGQKETLRSETVRIAESQFIESFTAFSRRSARPTIILFCPISQSASASSELRGVLESAEQEIIEAVSRLPTVSVITSNDLTALYPTRFVEDPDSDREGHIPFTRSFWVAAGTILARRARTLLQVPRKVIGVDADNTLWGGIVAELGADQVRVDGAWREIQTFLRNLKNQGILLVLLSKNQEKDVSEVFNRPDMVLRREDFVDWRVNWTPKSENLRASAADLGLGLNSFVFLDDNPMECAEVAAHCPGVTVLSLPGQAEKIPSFLRHAWVFDLPSTTSTDRSRTEQYRDQADRRQLQASAGSYRDFIEKLELKMNMASPASEQLDRAAQLTQRTNQFNTTGVRRNLSELRDLIASGERRALLVRVQDRFGDYGDVGLCVYSAGNGEIYVENFLLSCRVLGKGVEHRMLSALGRLGEETGNSFVVIPFRRTERNEPAARFLESIGSTFRQEGLYRFPVKAARDIAFNPEEVVTASSAETPFETGDVDSRADFAEIANSLFSVEAIELAIRRKRFSVRPALATPFVPPRSQVEQTLANIWADTLGLDRVGACDNFFDLGGDSILSIQIMSKASQCGLRFTLRQQFQFPTIADLASVITLADSERITAEQGTVTGLCPLTPIQSWFFEKELPDSNYWNMEMLLESRQELSLDVLQRALVHLIGHHDALRMRFHCGEEGWFQENETEESHNVFSQYDFSSLPAEEQNIEMRRMAELAHSSLNLQEGPLLRAVWFDLGQTRAGRLLIVIHHLVVDGITWRVLLEDLQILYRQLDRGSIARLPLKSNSYLQWAKGVTDYAKSSQLMSELHYWQASSRDEPTSLPIDHPGSRNAGSEATAQIAVVSLEEGETRSLLSEAPKAYQTQINDILLTALVLAFNRWSGHNTLLIDLEGHGRESIIPGSDFSRTAGWFTSIFPVLLRLDQPDNLGLSLKSVKEQLRGVPNRGVGYGLLRYTHGDVTVRRSLSKMTGAEVMFNYLGQFDQVLPADGLFDLSQGSGSGASLHGRMGRRSHLLEIIGRVTTGRLHVEFTFSEQVFRRKTIETLATQFSEELRILIQHCLTPGAGGSTPSDFPLANLGQRSLDEVLMRLAKTRK